MDVVTLRRLRTELLTEAEKITQAKQPGYIMGRADALSNFKTVAERMGVTPMQAWGIYFLKHVDSISAYAKDPKIPQGEAMIGRFADAINYLCLGWALYQDSTKAGNPFEAPSTVYWDEERRSGRHSVYDGDGMPKSSLFKWHRNPDHGASASNEPRFNLPWRKLTPFGWIYSHSCTPDPDAVPGGEDDGA